MDTDRYGRELRYVALPCPALPGSGGNVGEYMVGFDHTGVYEGGVRVVPEGRSVGQ